MPHDPGPTDDQPLLRHLARTPRRHGPRRDHLDPRGARFLDPRTAARFVGQHLEPTAYQGDGLLVRPGPHGRVEKDVLEALQRAAAAEGWALRLDRADEELLELLAGAGIAEEGAGPLVVRAVLERREDDELPRPTPDAWPVLQRYRMLVDPALRGRVQLQHLLTTGADQPGGGVRGNYYVAHGPHPNYYVAHGPHPDYYVAHRPGPNYYVAHATEPSPSDSATEEYAQPGSGGRMPVQWVGFPPSRLDEAGLGGRRRPVVAVLDTGTGTHPWLGDDVVDRAPTCGPTRIGLTDEKTDVERRGVVTGELTGSLDIEAGHGTFVAGLVHQRCPDARILSVRVVQPDGVVDEYDVLRALNKLWVRQALALHEKRPEDLVDVVSISLGYYHEDPADAAFDPLLLAPLRALGRLGVLVVTSAGNDATFRPIYPAAFAPHPGGLVGAASADEVPLVAVGALNPDGTVALFSNDGPWVRAWRPGAGLVSTAPTTFDGGREPSSSTTHGRTVRSTIDPDDFSSGFATWSGTSFAAPILAGDVAQRLLDQAVAGRAEDAAVRVREAWRAVRAAVPGLEEVP